ncbi:uncharacterized protein LOC114260431 isoform X6 [Camellia sinensis]|uniref:uncharacterized protein LOC114260431 isoform X6 n=1 Tax=Camellia sinensis TaxID=4442 RepID=UPI001035EAAA|nr:uncharacterized protein LOC114260431 isoform X6 [Camellia sinensis]
MATDQRASPFPLLLLLLSLLIDVVAALASRRRWPFQRCFSSHRCCFSLSGLCFLIHCHSALEKRLLYDSIIMDEHFKGQRCACGYFLTPSSSSPCCCLQQLIWPLYTLPLLLIFVFHLLFLVLLLVSHTGNLLRIAIFNISYIRGLFPEKYFNDKSVPALGELVIIRFTSSFL